MKKRLLLLAPALILGSTLAIGGGTFALFSASAANSGNTFTAGTLTIKLDHQDSDKPAVTYFDVNAMAPGDSEIAPVIITNTGSLQLTYTLSLSVGGRLSSGSTPLAIAAYPSKADADAGTKQIDLTQARVLDANGGNETLYVKVTLPLNANNDYQGKNGTASISVNAVQSATPHASNGPAPGPVTWTSPQYNDRAWVPAVDEGVSGNGWLAPTGSDVYWAHSDPLPGETTYYRADFTTDQAETLTLNGTADNHLIVYLDGQNVLSGDSYTTLFSSQAINVPAGQHTIAVQATNDGGPAGFSVAAVQSDNTLIPLTWKTGNVN